MISRAEAIAELERRIGHAFADRDLLDRALTHASVGNGSAKIRDNERLEFLGDRVLNLVVAESLIQQKPDAQEGDLSRAMSQLVNYHACAVVARAAGVREALRFDASASKVGARDNDRVLGDACEALIAALYLDGGIDSARRFILEFWTEAFAGVDAPERKDPKTLLNEWAMGQGKPAPRYRVLATEGAAHAPRFTVEAQVEGFAPSTAAAGSKKEAEKLAAERLLAAHGALS
ncbi:ribonuclease III [Phenylobacterium immobile]|uniref:ribonuclease III n=1 Tax=Phenylobacterium immobile TaxID=21 RepID=UPI000AC99117|nr:ribonuclease III [Phenylobacterium immobile]